MAFIMFQNIDFDLFHKINLIYSLSSKS